MRELKGFAKVALEPGESPAVRSRSTSGRSPSGPSCWPLGRGGGEFAIEVGRHSRDLPLTQSVTVDAPSIAAPITADSTLHEWMADPVAAALLEGGRREGQTDPTRDAELVSVIGTMPMSTLAAFEGMASTTRPSTSSRSAGATDGTGLRATRSNRSGLRCSRCTESRFRYVREVLSRWG